MESMNLKRYCLTMYSAQNNIVLRVLELNHEIKLQLLD